MADTPIVHIGENSPEQVAYKLLETIASNEDKSLEASVAGKATVGRGTAAPITPPGRFFHAGL